MGTRFPLMASERTFVMFRFCLCSHESSLRGKKRSSRGLLLILADFCASFYGALRPRLSQVAASDFAVRVSVVEAIRRFRRTSRLVSALRNPSPIFNRLLGDDLRLSQPPIFARRNTDLSVEDSSEMAWASVTNIESYLDCAPVSLPQQTASLLQS